MDKFLEVLSMVRLIPFDGDLKVYPILTISSHKERKVIGIVFELHSYEDEKVLLPFSSVERSAMAAFVKYAFQQDITFGTFSDTGYEFPVMLGEYLDK